MKKPAWGLWLLMIIAPVAVFFGVTYLKNLPPPLDSQATELADKGQPLVSDVCIAEIFGSHNYGVSVMLCNPTRDKLIAKLIIVNGASELAVNSTNRSFAFSAGSRMITLSIKNEARLFGVCEIKPNRKQTIRFKVYWQLGKNSGIKHIVITPRMNSINANSQGLV